jgi:hypothetical protein
MIKAAILSVGGAPEPLSEKGTNPRKGIGCKSSLAVAQFETSVPLSSQAKPARFSQLHVLAESSTLYFCLFPCWEIVIRVK